MNYNSYIIINYTILHQLLREIYKEHMHRYGIPTIYVAGMNKKYKKLLFITTKSLKVHLLTLQKDSERSINIVKARLMRNAR